MFRSSSCRAKSTIRLLNKRKSRNTSLSINTAQIISLYICILAVSLASYIILHLSASGARWLSPIAMNITVRIMGLLLAAVAIQFALNAARELFAHSSPPV